MRVTGGVLAVMALGACADAEPATVRRVAGGEVERGKLLVSAYGCGSCHLIPRVNGADGVVGPPLDDWADRQWIAGTLRNEPANLVAWLEDPQRIEPGTAMPAQGVTPEEARHIAAFLYTLHSEQQGPPHLLPRSVLEALGYEKKPAPTVGGQSSGQ